MQRNPTVWKNKILRGLEGRLSLSPMRRKARRGSPSSGHHESETRSLERRPLSHGYRYSDFAACNSFAAFIMS